MPIISLLLNQNESNQSRYYILDGVFYNLKAKAGGTLRGSMRIEGNTANGFMDFTEMPLDNIPLCGAGNLSGTFINENLTGSFISNDNDTDCWFDDGGIFTISGNLDSTGHYNGTYSATNSNGSSLNEGGGVFESWVTKPQLVTYSGTFTNTTYTRHGTVKLHIFLGQSTVFGNINYSNLPGENLLCGAGEFTGVRNPDNTIEFSFISNDEDSGCTFNDGVRFIQNATISENSISGTYSSGQAGVFTVNRVD